MQDLNNAVQNIMEKMVADGAVEKMIEEQMHSMIKSTMQSVLSSHSDFGRSVRQHVENNLTVNLDKVSLVEYNKVIHNMIEGLMNQAVSAEAQTQFKQNLDKLFGAPPKEITLSELIETYKEEQSEYAQPDSEKMGLVIDDNQKGWIRVGLHPESAKGYTLEPVTRWQDCDLYLSIRVSTDNPMMGELSWTTDRSIHGPQFMPTCMHGTSRLLYQMYCAGSSIILDEGLCSEDYNIWYSED